MPDPSGAYFGYDEDPYGRPGGQTATSTFERMDPRRAAETQPWPWTRSGAADSAGTTGGINERNRTLWDLLLGRQGTEYQGPPSQGTLSSGPPPRDSAGVTGGAGDRNRNFWDRLFGRKTGHGQEYMGPQEAYGPPAGASNDMPSGDAYGPPTSLSPRAPPPSAPPAKPVTKLSSNQQLADAIRALINPPQPSGAMTLGIPGWEGTDAMRLGQAPPRQLPPYDLPPYMSAPYREEDLRRPIPSVGQRMAMQATPGGNKFGGNRFGGNIFGGNLFGPEARAEGGPIAQRGGYPELYDKPVRQGYFASGGPSQYVTPDGRGDGRSDHIEARLSPGEYVMDAETTSLLGDGDSQAGARKLDQMRQNIRKQKGAKLAQGDISPKARPKAEEYMSKSLSRSALKNVGR